MPKQVPPLNARQLECLKADPTRRLELVDGFVPGLRVRLSPSRMVVWSLNVRVDGERRRLAVGEGLSLSDARRRAEEMRRAISRGEDPAAEARARRKRVADAKAGSGTFGTVIETYFTNGPGAPLKTGPIQRRCIETVFAPHLGKPALDVKTGELQLSIDRWPSKSSGQHAAAYVRPVWRWAAKRGFMGVGFDALEAPAMGRESVKQPFLTAPAVARLLGVLGNAAHDAAARAMLMTACRREEVCGATWGEIDLAAGTWTIAGQRRKDTRTAASVRRRGTADHTIPLPRQLRDELQGRAGAPEALVWPGPRGAQLGNWPRWSAIVEKKTGLTDVGPHTLRRTAATLLGELGCAPHVVSAALGHSAIGGSLLAGYSKATYSREVGEALQQLADRLEGLERGLNNVVALPCGVTA